MIPQGSALKNCNAVNHAKLVHKLQAYGVHGSLYEFNYLFS